MSTYFDTRTFVQKQTFTFTINSIGQSFVSLYTFPEGLAYFTIESIELRRTGSPIAWVNLQLGNQNSVVSNAFDPSGHFVTNVYQWWHKKMGSGYPTSFQTVYSNLEYNTKFTAKTGYEDPIPISGDRLLALPDANPLGMRDAPGTTLRMYYNRADSGGSAECRIKIRTVAFGN